ncbi:MULTISPECIES: hypothetical protein [Bradyrhizobium]|uniref:hypothetical protein n=1 Tax=Bradyrhizobium TaxID=374 RepID=UPI0004130746|nr:MULTISPECIES: hypothetical protein [Bradyrhizobium]WLB92212.1 hypothetical protein QIH91_18830 [Bradyrhizobium japonicum USDA 135]GLR95723.1 hypothetical protein GCM10007858_33600 [Bradyrhizobium liaoningense]
MHVRTRWPWLSLLLGAVVALNPIGLDFLRSAFFAGEQLARNIAQPIVLTALAVMVVVVVLEWLVRSLLVKRRARGAS